MMFDHFEECPRSAADTPDWVRCSCREIEEALREVHEEMLADQMREEGW